MPMNLKSRIERLEQQARFRRRLEPLHAEIARRQQEGRKRVAEWLRRQEEEAAEEANDAG